jgi:hypothetical protein
MKITHLQKGVTTSTAATREGMFGMRGGMLVQFKGEGEEGKPTI